MPIIAESPESSAIAQPIVIEPVENSPSKPGWPRRLITFLWEDLPAGAGFPALAGILDLASAGIWQPSIEGAGFGNRRAVEDAMR